MGAGDRGVGRLSYLQFWVDYREDVLALVAQHLMIVVLALPVASVLGILLGVALVDRPRAAGIAEGLAGVMTTVPSVALFGLMIPLLGTVGLGAGRPPAILAIILYSILPILRNTLTGLRSVPAETLEAAKGIGMTDVQVLARIRLPWALPAILSGVRTAVVMGIGITTIAAYVGAGGLGRWVFGGIRRSYPEMALAGALSISLLAFFADSFVAFLQRRAGLRLGTPA